MLDGWQVFSAQTAELITFHQVEVTQKTPVEGWVEADPVELLRSVELCVEKTVENLKDLDIDPTDIKAIGICNQRETTIVWDKFTGQPLHNAIGSLLENKNFLVLQRFMLSNLSIYLKKC